MLFSSRVRIRIRIRFSVWLVSYYAHVFVLLYVVIFTDRVWRSGNDVRHINKVLSYVEPG